MAQVALPIAANALFPGLGAVGSTLLLAGTAAVGGYVDAKYTYPFIFGDNSTSPTINPQGQTVEDGAASNLCYGRTAIAPGQIVWLGPLTSQEKAGSIEVYREMAVIACRNPIANILEIRANGELIYIPPNVPYIGSIGFAPRDAGPVFTNNWVYFRTIGAGAISPTFNIGANLTVSGALNSVNNGTFTIERSVFNGPFRQRSLSVDNLAMVEEVFTPNVTLSQDLAFKSGKIVSIETYNGTDTQLPNPSIASVEGAANTPAFRGTSYIYLKLRIDSFGGIPPEFTFLIQEDGSKTLEQYITNVMNLGNVIPSSYDVSDLSAIAFRGTTINGFHPIEQLLQVLIVAYDLIVYEADSIVYLKKRTSADTINLTLDDIGFSAKGAEITEPLQFSDTSSSGIPRRINVVYQDPDNQYQNTTMPEITSVGDLNHEETINLPIVLETEEARNIAQRILWDFRVQRKNVELKTTFRNIKITPGDELVITCGAEVYTLQVQSVTRNLVGLITIGAAFLNSSSATQSIITDSNLSFPSQAIDIVQFILSEMLDIPAISDSQVSIPLIYFAGSAPNEVIYRGVEVYQTNNFLDFSLVGAQSTPHFMGVSDTILPSTTNFYNFDLISTVNVTMLNGTLESVSQENILEDRFNMAILGGEILYYQTATLIGPNQYTLSRLLRGVRNTEDQVGTHAVDERFVLLRSNLAPSPGIVGLSFSDLNKEQTFTAVGVNAGPDEGNDHILSPILASLRPFSPVNLTAKRLAADIEISWVRRSRSFGGEFNDGGTPLVDGVELYSLEILDAPGGNILRTIENISTPTYLYTAAQQTEDGLTPPEDPLYIRVYQVNPSYGRGKGKEGTI